MLTNCSLERCASDRHIASGVVQQAMVHQIVLVVGIGKRFVVIVAFFAVHFFIGKGQGSSSITTNCNCAQRRDRVIGIAGQINAGASGNTNRGVVRIIVFGAEIAPDIPCRVLRDAPGENLCGSS